jgi:hypothetical protein
MSNFDFAGQVSSMRAWTNPAVIKEKSDGGVPGDVAARSCWKNFIALKQVCKVTPAVHNADDLDLIDLTFVNIRTGFKKNEIRSFNQHAHRRPNFGASPPESGKGPSAFALVSIAVQRRSAAAGLSSATMT